MAGLEMRDSCKQLMVWESLHLLSSISWKQLHVSNLKICTEISTCTHTQHVKGNHLNQPIYRTALETKNILCKSQNVHTSSIGQHHQTKEGHEKLAYGQCFVHNGWIGERISSNILQWRTGLHLRHWINLKAILYCYSVSTFIFDIMWLVFWS